VVLEQTTSRRGNGKAAINLKKTGEEISFLENPNENIEAVLCHKKISNTTKKKKKRVRARGKENEVSGAFPPETKHHLFS